MTQSCCEVLVDISQSCVIAEINVEIVRLTPQKWSKVSRGEAK